MFLSRDWKARIIRTDLGFEIRVSGCARTGMHTILPEINKIYPPDFDKRILHLGLSHVVDNPHGILHDVIYQEPVASIGEYRSVRVFIGSELLVEMDIIDLEE